MPDTFSCERARTENVGVVPHGAHVRRSTGIIRKPVSSRQIRWAPRRASFFYPGPVLLDPLAHAAIVALLGPRLGTLRTGRPGAQPRHARGSHAAGVRSRGPAAARVQPGSPVGACAPPTEEYRTLLMQMSLIDRMGGLERAPQAPPTLGAPRVTRGAPRQA